MAIEDIAVVFYSGTTPAVSGKTLNSYNSGLTAGELDADLDGYDTGASTGVSFDLGTSRTVSTNGRNAGATTLISETNREGAYDSSASNTCTDTFTVPSTVTAVDVVVYLCTTFADQTDMDVDVNGSTQTAFDSSNNTTGSVLTFSGIAPNGSNQIDIQITDNESSLDFIFINGYGLQNFVEAADPYVQPLEQKIYRKSGRFL